MVTLDNGVDEVSVDDAWKRLGADAAAQLVDVRTRAEWTYVGIPDLGSLKKDALLHEWQSYPTNQPDPDFALKLDAVIAARGLGKNTNLYFICRSGARSLSAARAMSSLGYSSCHNVRDGFEGPLSPDRHRGVAGGWKHAGLPWSQS